MTNVDRNTRTLIVSFAIAIMALIPLRFVEVGQMMSMYSESQVLGVETIQDVVLPEVNVDVNQNAEGVLEAPYDQIDGLSQPQQEVLGASTEVPVSQDCIAVSDATVVTDSLRTELAKPGLDSRVRVELLNQIRTVEVNMCR